MGSNTFSQDDQDTLGIYPDEWVEQVELRNGTAVIIRPIHPSDARRLRLGFRHLSQQSIYLRFLGLISHLTEEQAQSYANLDYRNQMAFVACILSNGKEILIGVARYAMVNPDEPGLAEFAIVVGDEFQGLGLGSLLLDRLVRYGRSKGVTEILATIHSTNAQIKRFIQKSGFTTHKKMLEPGVWEIRMVI